MADYHIRFPLRLVKRLKELAEKNRRKTTEQIAFLLETHPEWAETRPKWTAK